MSCSVLQHSFARSLSNEVRQGSFPTNLQSLKSHFRLGWTSLLSTVLSWFYDGPLHPTCRCTEARFLLRGTNVHEEFLSSSSANFWQTVLGVVSGPQPCNKVVEGQVRGVVCSAPVQADIQVLDLLFHFWPSVSETADGGITQLIERNIGQESCQVLLWSWAPLRCPRTLRQLVVSCRG